MEDMKIRGTLSMNGVLQLSTGTFIIQNFWTTLGYDYHMPNEDQSSFAERYAEKKCLRGRIQAVFAVKKA